MLSGGSGFGKPAAAGALDRFLIPPGTRRMFGGVMEVRMLRRVLAALAALLAAGAAQAADLPGTIVIQRPIQVDNPCADPHVLSRIVDRFAWAERNTWHRGLVMTSLENARPGDHPYFEPGLVKRDYCAADGFMSDGSVRPVYYAIEYGVGFASIGNYVDFCVLGLDPWHVHDEACRTVR